MADETENDRHGGRLRCAIADEFDAVEIVVGVSPMIYGSGDFEEKVCRAIARRAGGFPIETRMSDLRSSDVYVSEHDGDAFARAARQPAGVTQG